MTLVGHLEISGLTAEETSWEMAKKIAMEAVPWADQVIITAVTQPLIEMTLLAGTHNEERVMHTPTGPLQIYFVATGPLEW